MHKLDIIKLLPTIEEIENYNIRHRIMVKRILNINKILDINLDEKIISKG